MQDADRRAGTEMLLPGLGTLALGAYVVQALLSWPLAASQQSPAQQAYFGAWPWALGWFPDDRAFMLAYAGPLLVATACALLSVWVVAVGSGEPSRQARLAFAWACAFAGASLPAANVLQQDSWLTVAWGRTILRGDDPYLVPFSAEDAAGLPLDEPPITMTYGPLWAAAAAVVSALAGGSGELAWALQKLVLLACWIVCLVCVRALARPLGPRREAMALILVGWLPVGVHLAVAEAHNDVMMVALMLVALAARQAAPLALAGSVLVKYVTAPLVPVALLYEWQTARAGLYKRLLPAAVLFVAGALFVLCGGRLRETLGMRSWHFLDPADPLRLIGIPGTYAVWAMRLVFGAIALLDIVRLWRQPTISALIAAELAVMAFVLFATVGHVWPWFLLWLLPLAALVLDRPLAVFVLAVACVAPFTIVHYWRVTEDAFVLQLAATLMYGTGLATLAAWGVRSTRRRYRRSGHGNRHPVPFKQML